MASSRLERIGTIFSRVTGLLRSGAIKWDDRPLWYNVYRAFPPLKELTYGAPKPTDAIRPIFYPEDKIRAEFQESKIPLEPVRLDDQSSHSECQLFISNVQELQEQKNLSEKEAFNEALVAFKKSITKTDKSKSLTSGSDFREASKKPHKSVSSHFVADVFKD